MSFYTPSTVGSLDRAASLAYDFQTMDAYLVSSTRDEAKAIYEYGAYCLSYAELSLDVALEQVIPVGAVVRGVAVSSSTNNDSPLAEAEGRVLQRASVGATTLQVRYLFTESSSGPTLCSVGGNPKPNLDQCFKSTGQIQVTLDASPVTLNYTSYHPKTHTKNALTLEQLSTDLLTLPTTNLGQESHFQIVFQSYVDYYGSADYGNKWIQAAFQQITTNMDNGNASFSIFSNPQDVNAAISLGTLTMNVWMHVGRTMDSALQKCRSSSSTGTAGSSPLYDWDDAMAFYAGTLGASDGSLSQLYGLADQYCHWFGTCHDQKTEGRAIVNQEILRLWEEGTQHLLNKECDSVEPVVRKIMAQMTIPLVQGLLYHTYELDVRQQQQADNQAMRVEAATFAAALLPRIHQCNPGNADSIYHNIKLTVEGSYPSFHVVKGALERQYDCLGITCEHVGGIVDIGNPSEFAAFAEPCGGDPKSVDDGNNGASSMTVPTMKTNPHNHNQGFKVGISMSALLIGVLIGLILVHTRRGRCFHRPRTDEKEFDSAVAKAEVTGSSTSTVDPCPAGDTREGPDIELEAEML